MEKKIRAVLSPEAKESWDELNRIIAEEVEKGGNKILQPATFQINKKG